MQPAKINYKIYQGSTFQNIYRWESETKVYVPISAIQKSAPCMITTQSNHSLPLGWRFRVVGAGGMKEINSVGDNYYYSSAVTNTTVEINQLNSLSFTTYTSGGVIEYNQPVDLSNYGARMQIRESVDSSTVIHEATTTNGQIVIDNTTKTIKITLLANITQNFTFTTAVYSVELFSGNNTNNVVPFLSGNLTLVREVTR